MRQLSTFAMSNLSGAETGLGNIVIFLFQESGSMHACHIEVSNIRGKLSPNDVFTITLADRHVAGPMKLEEEELESIKDWIEMNRDVILRYWQSDTFSTAQMLSEIKKLPPRVNPRQQSKKARIDRGNHRPIGRLR